MTRISRHAHNSSSIKSVASEFTKDAVRVAPGAFGPQAIEEIFKTQFKVGFNHIDLTVDQVSPLGTDAAITVGKHHVIGQGQSGPLRADGPWSEVEVREGGVWKFRALTIVKNPPPQSPAPSGTNR
jgi:ketosteroid isomerase-like protein